MIGAPPRSLAAAPGEIIVQFKDGIPSNTRHAVFNHLGARLKRHGYRDVFDVVTVRGQSAFNAALARLRRTPGVVAAEPNYYVTASDVNDTFFKPYQWSY